MRPAGWAGVVIMCACASAWSCGASAQAVYRVKLETQFAFDGQPFTATGYMECTYRKAPISGSRPHPAEGPPIYEGYYTETLRDAPSMVLPDGKGAILFRHGGSCFSLPQIRKIFAASRESVRGEAKLAYYFPDRDDPKVIWILRDRRPAHRDHGRLVLQQHRYVLVDEAQPLSLAQNVPAAWRWYEQMSAQHRTGRFTHRGQDMWTAIVACVMHEDQWRKIPEFVQAAAGLTTTTVVDLRHRAGEMRPCGGRTPQISLVPSDEYSKATLDIDRDDLRWAAIATPYVAQYRLPGTAIWTAEICIAGEGCTGIHMQKAFWLYLPSRRVFVRFDQHRLETFRFPDFALRPGDGL